MEPQQQRPNELVSQDSREEQPEQVISKSSESDNVIHDVINAEKIIPPIIVSAMPVELIGKIDLRRCTSPPHELSPYLNSNGIRMNLKLVPEPMGPDCKTESPLGAKTIETIRLHGRKDAGAPPGETDFYSRVSVAQADLAVSPFKNQPKWQIKKEQSRNKKVQSIPMQRAHGKENKKQRSLVPCDEDITDSGNDFLPNILPLVTKRSAAQRP